jgi:HD-like signal output (HDOD) protein
MIILSLLVLLIVLVIAYSHRKKGGRGSAAKPDLPPSPPGERLTPAIPPRQSGAPQGRAGGGGDGQSLSAGLYAETTPDPFQLSWATDAGWIFSPAVPSGDGLKPPLRLDDVRPEVLLEVRRQIGTLRNFDAIHELQRTLGAPDATMNELTRLITRNPILSAKILQVANSSYYGMQQKLNSISHALMIIGMANLKAILYHEGVLNALRENNFRDRPEMQALWQHVNYTSIMASYVHYLFGGLNMGTLFTLGLLHDIGKFIMVRLAPAGQSVPGGGYSPNWTMAEEEAVYGINHALVGRLALQHWGLSPVMVEAVAHHHAPSVLPPADLGLDPEALRYLLVLFLADRASHRFAGAVGGQEIRQDGLHPGYHGLLDKDQLVRLLQDKSLLTQLLEARAITGVYT